MSSTTVLITGASGGIGAELARIFAAQGYALVLVARNKTKLEEMAGGFAKAYQTQTTIIAKDLIRPEAGPELFAELAAAGIRVEILINNAGFGEYGFFEEISWARHHDMMQLNMVALTHLTRLFLDQLPAGTPGRILNIASVAAYQPGPLMAVYFATKAFVLSFSEALANELQTRKVTVTALCPGPTSTGFEKQANLQDSPVFSGKLASAAGVAQAGFEGLMAGRRVVVPGLKNKLLVLSARLAPRGLAARIVRFMQEKK